MKKLQKSIPAPSDSELIRQNAFLVWNRPEKELPEGFPENTIREKLLKESGSVAAFLCGNGRYFCKIYKFRGIFHSLKRTFRTPRAFRCFAGARLLAEHGFQTPEPVAAAVRMQGPVPLYQILINEALPEETTYLDKAIQDLPPEDAEALLCAVTGFAARLHHAGFIHGDMSLRNFYALPEAGNFGLIDLDGIRYCPQGISRKAASKEIARLISSAFRCRKKKSVCQEDWLEHALQSYRQNGGTDLCTSDLCRTIDRLLKHRIHPVWKG